jgi:hypothetical protein
MSGEGQAVWREGVAPLSVRRWKGCGRWLGRWLRPLGPVVLVGVVLAVAGFWLGRLRHINWQALSPSLQDMPQKGQERAGSAEEITFTLPPVFADEEEGTRRYTFQVTNRRKSPVVLEKIVSSCGCAHAELRRQKLLPGETTELYVEVDLRQRQGPVHVRCQVFTESGDLFGTYNVITRAYRAFLFAPPQLFFGEIDPQTEQEKNVQIYLYGPSRKELPHILEWRVEGEGVHVKLGPEGVPQTAEGAVTQVIPLRILLDKQSQSGRGQALVVVRYVFRGKQREMQLPVVWNVRSLYEIQPARAYFGYVKKGNPSVQVIRIWRRDGMPLHLRKVTAPTANVQVRLLSQTAVQKPAIQVTILPEQITRPLWGEIVVETDHPLQPVLRIPVSALPQED